ncbi:MAG: flavodoxin domain-containing protein [bacterium]|nr:flavodoxin domain-containing protein [bacterium]
MKTAIIFASTHGCAETCAGKLAEKLKGEIHRFNLKDKPRVDLASYDRIVIGGSIHAGRIQGSVRRFVDANREALSGGKFGLFLCCMEKGEAAQKEFDAVFPEDIRQKASAVGLFGGAFNFEKMNFITKAIVRKIAKTDKSVSNIDEQAIARFAEEISRD